MVTGESPEYSVDFAITKLRFEEVLGQFEVNQSTRGELDLRSHLTMKGKNADEIIRTVQVDISIRGQNLFTEILDLDLMLEKYERSQNFKLIDVGTFFIVGPLGSLLTKGYNFGSLYEESQGGKSTILKFVSDWKIKNGIAVAEEVALSTRQNRVALKGRLDFVTQQFDSKNTSLAVVAPGISEALFATALGLVAAIPAVIAFNKLSSDLTRYAGRLEAFAGEFGAILSRQLEERP